MEKEEWQEIAVFPRYYIITLGRVKSYNKKNKITILKLHLTKDKYYELTLYTEDKEKITCRVHQLVLKTFVGPCPEGMETSHLNSIRTDNRLSNLRWETKSQNQRRRIDNNTDLKGMKQPRSKLSDRQIRRIRKQYLKGEHTVKDLSLLYKVSSTVIQKVIKYEIWKHIDSDLNNEMYKENIKNVVSNLTSKHSAGENNHFAITTEEKVKIIRKIYAEGNVTQVELGRIFGMSESGINHIIKRKTWKGTE